MSLQSKLIEYGLTEKEARIYLSSMELGPSPVQKIAKHADINRVTAYAVIDILMEKGLMSTFEDGKRTVYVASEPESLMNLFDQQKRSIDDHEKDLQKTLPEFRSKYNLAEGKPIVRYYEGLDGVISMNDDTLQVDSDKIFTSYNIDVVNNFFSSEFLERLKERRIKKGINITDGCNEKPKNGNQRRDPRTGSPNTSSAAKTTIPMIDSSALV